MGMTSRRTLTGGVLFLSLVSAAAAYTWTSDWLLSVDLRSPSFGRNQDQWPCLCALPGNSGTYLWNSGTGWSSEAIPDIDPTGHFSNLAFDTLGYPHTTTKLDWSWHFVHVYKDGGGWHQEQLASDVAIWSRIQCDQSNVLHVIYSYGNQLYYMKRKSTGWSTALAVGSQDDPAYNGTAHGDMALDADGHPHIVHNLFTTTKGIEHVYWDGYAWRTEYIQTGTSSFGRSEIEIDAGGRLHVLYHKGDSVKYAIRDRDGWHISPVASSYTYPWMSLALDYRGLARAAACQSVSQLNYLTYDGSSWSGEGVINVDANGTQLDLGCSGEPFIAYGDYTNHYLRVAHPQYYHPGAFTLLDPPNGAWANASPMFRWNPCSYLGDSLNRYDLFIDGAYNCSVTPPTVTACRPASPLSSGWHTWRVVAVETNGDRDSTATWSVQVDATGPSAFNLQTPANNAWTVQRHPTFSWTTSSDGGSGLRKYQVIIDGFKADDSVPATQTSSQSLVSLPDGSHTWSIRAVDNAGNVTPSNQTWTVKVDSTGPAYFSLISPDDYSYTGNPRPTFVWHRTTDAGVGLRWYQLWTRLSSGQWQLTQDSITDTTYALRSGQALTNGTWNWEVVALDSLGNQTEDEYGYWTLYVDLQPPLAFNLVTPLDGATVSLPTPTFTWRSTTDASSGLSHYELWLDSALNVDNLSDTFSAPAAPLPEGPHRWWVKAVDNVGNVRESNSRRTVYLDWNPPDTFSLAAPPDNDTTYLQQPRLYWHPAHDSGSGIRKYRLYVNGTVSRDSVPAAETSATPASPLAYGSHAPWYVVAFDRADGSRSSNQTWYINIKHDSVAPTVPLQVSPDSASVIQDTLPHFVWQHSNDDYSGIDHYTLQYARNPGFAGAESVDLADTNYVPASRMSDTTWYWRVRAVDRAANRSGWSVVWSFEVDARVPAAPTLLEPVGDTWRSSGSVLFRWSAVTVGLDASSISGIGPGRSGAARFGDVGHQIAGTKSAHGPLSPVRYVVQIDTTSSFVSPVVVDTTAFTQDTISLAEHHYFWRAMAFDAAGNQGLFSGADSFGVDLTAPTLPLLVAPPNDTTLSDTSVLLVWNHSTDQASGVAWYRVQVAYDSGFASVLVDTTLTDTTCEHNLPESLFYWHVRATDRAGNPSSYSLSRRFRLWIPLPNVEEPASGVPLEYGLLLPFPQPFSAGVRLVYRLAKAGNVSLAVFDASGRRVKTLIDGEQKAGEWSVTWNGTDDSRRMLPRGTYFCQLRAGEFTALRKMVKTE